MLFRCQSTKLHFVVPRGTPNDSSVKYVSSWFPDFVSEGVFTISYAVPHAHDIQNLGFRVIFDPKSSFISLFASNSRELEGSEKETRPMEERRFNY